MSKQKIQNLLLSAFLLMGVGMVILPAQPVYADEHNNDNRPICAGVTSCPMENPAPPAWAEYRAHPTDCNKFCQCDWGVAIEMPCPEGLVFNADANPGPVCDYPENVPRCDNTEGNLGNSTLASGQQCNP